MEQTGDGAADTKRPASKSLGGPFEQPLPPAAPDPSQHDAIGAFIQQLNAPGSVNCKDVYKSGENAAQIGTDAFDACFYGHTDSQGKSLELKTPIMHPDTDGKPKPQLEKITTEGITMDSRRLDVFVHALPAVRPVSFESPAGTFAGTAAMIAPDGIMVTNKHVVDGSNGTLQVKMLRSDGTEETRNAHVVKISAKQDLALLQLDHQPNESFAYLPLSQNTSWGAREPFVEMGNANGEGNISMAKARYGSMVQQSEIPFKEQPPDVLQGRTMYRMDATIPHGYSGGVLLSVPGSEREGNGEVQRTGTSAIRGITDYSNLDHKAYVIPAARVQFLMDEYRKEQAAQKKPQ